jgi:hypothetical protein
VTKCSPGHQFLECALTMMQRDSGLCRTAHLMQSQQDFILAHPSPHSIKAKRPPHSECTSWTSTLDRSMEHVTRPQKSDVQLIKVRSLQRASTAKQTCSVVFPHPANHSRQSWNLCLLGTSTGKLAPATMHHSSVEFRNLTYAKCCRTGSAAWLDQLDRQRQLLGGNGFPISASSRSNAACKLQGKEFPQCV